MLRSNNGVEKKIGIYLKKKTAGQVLTLSCNEHSKQADAEEQRELEKINTEALINSTDDLIWSVSSDFKLIAANRSFISGMRALTKRELKPNDFLLMPEVFTPEDLIFWKACYTRALQGEFFKKEVYTPAIHNWKETWAEISFNPIYKEQSILGIACYSRNITERKFAEEQVKKSEARLVAAQEVAKVGSWETQFPTMKVSWSLETYRIFETDPGKFSGMHADFLEFVHPEDRAKVQAAFVDSLGKDSIAKIEHRIITPGGAVKTVRESWRIFYDNQGQPERAIGTCHDITEQREAEKNSKDSEDRQKLIMNAALDAIICIDSKGDISFWNPQAELIFGWKEKEVMGKQLSELIIPGQFRQRHNEGMAQYAKTGKGPALNVLMELSAINKAGQEFPIEITIMPIRQHSEEFFCAFVRDITKRKNTEGELQAAYLEKNAILESISDAFFSVDKNWLVTFWNREAEKVLLKPRSEMMGRHLWEVFADSIGSDSYKNYRRAIDTGRAVQFEDYYPPLDKYYEISAYPSEMGLSVYFKDVTERKISDATIKKVYEEKNTILESIDDGFFAIDKNSLVTYWNNKAEILLNARREDVLGKNLHDMFAQPGNMAFHDHYQKAIRENTTVHFEEFSIRSNKWFAVSAFPTDNGLSVYFKDVTDRKASEEKIKDSELRYRSLIEQATDAICIADKEMKIIEINPRGCQLLGYTKEELLKISFAQLFPATELLTNPFKMEELKSGKVVSNERKLIKKDGSLVEVEMNAKILEDGRFVVFARDITERKKADVSLKESNERYNLISKATNDMVWDWDLVSGKVFRNKEGWKKILRTGDTNTDNQSTHAWDDRIHPEDREKINQTKAEIERSERDFFEVECRVLRDDGSYAYIHDRGNVIRDDKGKAIRLLGATQDITQRKEAELQLAKNDSRFRSLVQNSSDLISILNDKGYYLYSSPAAKRILGYEDADLIGKNAFTFIHPDDLITVKANLRQKNAGSPPEVITFRFRNIAGEWKWLESKVTDRSADPDILGYIFNSRDITERKIAEEEIEKLSIIARETVNAVIITDPEEKIVWVNEAFTRITEFEPEDVIGKKPGDILQGKETSEAVVRFMRAKIKNEEPFECDIINYAKSGRKYWLRIQCQPQFDETGRLKYFFAIETDITKEKEAEAILKASEERYRYLFDNNPASIFIWDIDSLQILEVNKTALEQYGYSREEFLSKTIMDHVMDRHKKEAGVFIAEIREKEDFRSVITSKHLNKSGELMYMSIASHRIHYKGRSVILALATNVTEKVYLEKLLEEERVIKQKEITAAVISAQEDERQEIGRELHDNINQILASSRLYLAMIKKESPVTLPYLEETDHLINTAISEIRSLSHSMISPSLNDSELVEALEHLINVTSKGCPLAICLKADGFDENVIPDDLKLTIYRIVQEQFTNILKYANASHIIVQLVQENEKITLRINDDGLGFDTTKKSTGVGLLNIKTRASLFNGELDIISSPGNGCELKVTFG